NQQDDLGGGVNNQNSQTSIQEEASNEVEEAPKALIQEDIISQKEISPKPLQQESLPQKPDTQEVFSPQEMITHQSELTIQEDSSMLETEILQEIAELEELTKEEKAISKTVFYQKLINDIKKFEVSAKRNLDTFKRLFFWQNF
ncbi:hypothetical protein, partial [Helicobacter kayseriensis]|uniref:hypothetical protein n=1 Tax=Helicobacter kayseriensis TaxID=2905877 RepID=UPI001E46A834